MKTALQEISTSTGENKYEGSSKNKHNYHMIQQSQFWVYKQRNWNQDMKTTQVFVNGWMDKEDAVYINNGILFRLKKEWNVALLDNTDGSWGHYAKWNKLDRERQITHDLTYTWNLKKSNRETQSIAVVTRGGGETKMRRYLSRGTSF